MTLDTALISGNLVFVTAFLAILIWRRVYIRLPVFVAYMGYTVLLALASLASLSNAADYLLVWDVGIAVDTLFYLCVLVELGRSVRRYNGASRVPQELLWLLFLGASVPIGLLTQWPGIVRLRLVYQLTFRVMQATAVLEIAALLTIALWSGFKKLRLAGARASPGYGHVLLGAGSVMRFDTPRAWTDGPRLPLARFVNAGVHLGRVHLLAALLLARSTRPSRSRDGQPGGQSSRSHRYRRQPPLKQNWPRRAGGIGIPHLGASSRRHDKSTRNVTLGHSPLDRSEVPPKCHLELKIARTSDRILLSLLSTHNPAG